MTANFTVYERHRDISMLCAKKCPAKMGEAPGWEILEDGDWAEQWGGMRTQEGVVQPLKQPFSPGGLGHLEINCNSRRCLLKMGDTSVHLVFC